MRILVTGGSGYLGTHVRRFFNADDFSRRSHLNILDPQDTKRVESYDVVIHLAALLNKDPKAADDCFATNALGTLNLIQNMHRGSVFIYASTKDVYGANAVEFDEVPETCSTEYCGQSALEWSKLIGERYLEFYAASRGVRSCTFRLSTVYARPTPGNQNGFVTHYVESVKNSRPIHLPTSADPVRDILYVDDFSRACQAFIDSSVQTARYNLGGGRANSAGLREIIKLISDMIHLPPVIEDDPHFVLPVPLHYISDLSRIQTELNWWPQVGMEEGLRNLL
jgi:nucleoside-diphosphate-sugar epimerase